MFGGETEFSLVAERCLGAGRAGRGPGPGRPPRTGLCRDFDEEARTDLFGGSSLLRALLVTVFSLAQDQVHRRVALGLQNFQNLPACRRWL